MERELLEEFIEWARECGEDAWYIFENESDAIDKFLKLKQSKVQQQQLDLTNITRLEVINHASNSHPIGRVLTMYEKTGDFTVVDAEFQDDGKTLKIFIS
jgi:hypothetical protein